MSAGTGGRRTGVPRRVLSREELLVAAREVITAHGYAGASVAGIAAHAGVSHGALYRYFPSKVDLFVEVFRDVCDREIRAAGKAAVAAEGPVERIDAVLRNFAERALDNPTLAWALIAEPVDPAVETVRSEYRLTYRRALERLLRRAEDAGAIPPGDHEIAAAALIGAGNEVLAGPLSPLASEHRDRAAAVETLRCMTRRAIGAATPGGPGGASGPG